MEEKCCIVHVSYINHTVFRNVGVKIRNSGDGNGIGGGHSVLRWAVAGGHDSALIATWNHGSHLAFVIKLVIAMQSL